MEGIVSSIVPVIVFIPLIVYHIKQFNKYKQTTMILKRFPNLSILITIFSCVTIIGCGIFQFSLFHCNSWLSADILGSIAICICCFGCYFAFNILELRIWLITFSNNYILAKQDSLWKVSINSKYNVNNNTTGGIGIDRNINNKRNSISIVVHNDNNNNKNNSNNNTNNNSTNSKNTKKIKVSRASNKRMNLVVANASNENNSNDESSMCENEHDTKQDTNTNTNRNIDVNDGTLQTISIPMKIGKKEKESSQNSSYRNLVSPRVTNNPTWYIKHKKTFGSYSFMIKYVIIKAIIESIIGTGASIYGYVYIQTNKAL